MAIDIIRIFAFIFIVFLHTLNRQFGVDVWMGGYAIISVGVNLFIMISGYLLLDKTEKAIVFFKKRILNILPIFLVFNIIYIYFGKIPIIPVLKGKIISASHFWYIYMNIRAVSSYAMAAKGVEICRKRDSLCSFSLVFVQYFKSVFTIF